MTGMIAGGWEFVWSAYGVTVAVLALYILSVLTRFSKERARSMQTTRTDD